MDSTILVVDDEPDVELLVTQRFRAAIRSKEFSFLFARDGEEALQILKSHPEVDVVLSDYVRYWYPPTVTCPISDAP